MPLLEVRGLSKYFGGLAAVNEVDLEVEKGEILGLVGPNGAGKTTMLNVISGFYRATRGKVIFKEEEITGRPPDRIASKGLVRTFQTTTLFPKFSVLDNMRIGLHLHARMGVLGAMWNLGRMRRRDGEATRRALEILEFMGLGEWKHELASNLPYGFQRVLGVAIALGTDAELVMLDEPVTGMNAEETSHMMHTINRLRRERGMAIILVEHNMRVVMNLCDRLTVLDFGKKIAEGTPEEVRGNRAVIEAYLGIEHAA